MPNKYRSKLEQRIACQIEENGVSLVYEDKGDRLEYVKQYQPDFRLPNGILIEAKGYHRNFGQALSKLCAVKVCNPDVDLRIVWDNAYMKVPFRKNKKQMTAWEWSEKNDFPWAHQVIPKAWFEEDQDG